MGLIWNKRKRLTPTTDLNLSKRGASVSKRVGRVSVNSRGRVSVGLGKGFRVKL